MSYSLEKYRDAQIYPYGSDDALLMEQNIGKFLEREYARYQANAESTIQSDNGPMWVATNELMTTHYDQSANLFSAFLDQTYKAYSMAYYGETPKMVRASTLSLEQAQEYKHKLICDRAGVSSGQKILNIGSGFGALEIYLLSNYSNLKLVSLTPSRVQAEELAKKQADQKHLFSHGNLTCIQSGFENISIELFGPKSFDLVISIGVLEHAHNLKAVFGKIDQLLKPGGISFHHLITSTNMIPRFTNSKKSLIGRYFPGGRIWPYATMQMQTQYISLENDWFINGLNYWRTLDAWHQRFWKNIEFLDSRLSLDEIRHWNDYFILCKACFSPADGTCFGNGHFRYRKA